MTYACPKGHASTEPDYCSECGIRMTAKVAAASPAPDAAAGDCPVCSTPRVAGARFCEVCRHDFVAGKPADASAAPSAPAAPSPPAAAPPPIVASPMAAGNPWAVVTADRALMTSADIGVTFPDNEPSRAYPLDLDENLVGRRNARANIHPEIPINDVSVSSRHLKICRRGNGGLYLVDVGSSNGTKLNDVAIEPGVEAPLKPGDQILIGAWTRIMIEMR